MSDQSADVWWLKQCTNSPPPGSNPELVEAISEHVDMPALIQTASERVARITGDRDPLTSETGSRMAAMFVDGFLVGIHFHLLKTGQQTTLDQVKKFLDMPYPEVVDNEGERYGYHVAVTELRETLGLKP
ncbi:hypothetical protein L3Y25_gp040 [Gordonia phage Syleon]|uniref:Uncharacterized protein n=3 Tax=Octobienvirus TaxID=3044779 RepID=A0AAE9C2W0_9CAUD|nr:hypothetical protein L3Y23_gp040 [Gordonia Phage Sephiroth]YP_010246558.1 hypothetical protein L3Y24_gp039 [Gordonia phage Kudefre]YP_010246699.1 hypothetical protein L3Y25_gp040 [Gordonia phage Syleon]QGH75769.1 hypothetical protein SEA_SYLEON_40 [Gordonia phage Syleon]QNN99384.1 hypothetical protein SEA_SEPHIROTH_40 [Gordonia Phage Sephiroth]UDL15273.1 hypothetical protein SEA_KUDEFRE_39 [Gordonia phage Kudefre]